MASLGAVLTGALEGYQDFQDRQQKRQLEQIDLLTKQQQLKADQFKDQLQQQQLLRSQKADENAAGILQGIYGGANQQPQPMQQPAPPPPQQMAPGQPSVPMQQPGQRPPPYQRIDTQMQQRQAAQQSVPAEPPAPQSLTFQGAVQMLRSKGIQGPALLDAMDRLQPYLNNEAKAEAASLKQQLQIQQASINAAKLDLQGRHDDALEANANARLALEQQRVQIEANRASQASADRAQAREDRQQAKEAAKIPTGYERDPKDPDALRPIKNGPYDPNGPSYRGNAQQVKEKINQNKTVAERMNPTMLASVKLDISEGRQALKAVQGLTTSTAGPYYAHDNASPIASLLHRELTTDQQQQFETLMNRMAVAIASVQSMGRGQISDAKVNEARKLVPQLGDSPGNRKRKIDQLNKIFDMADQTLNSKAGGNPAEPDMDREAATAGSVPGGGNALPQGWSVKVH